MSYKMADDQPGLYRNKGHIASYIRQCCADSSSHQYAVGLANGNKLFFALKNAVYFAPVCFL